MDGSGSPNCDHDDAGIAPGTSVADDPKASSPKRSRRFVQKRVVTFPVADADGSRPKGGGDGAPPSDSWAWRKYGQKPIKGSPYPRGYYKCSSSKGCPARKQVERSHVDPTVLVVTYACDHDHPWPLPKNHHHHQSSSPSAADSKQSPSQAALIHISPPDPDDKFSDLIGEDPAVMMHDDYYWFSDVGSPSTTSPAAATDELLLGPIAGSADVSMPFPVEDSWEEEEDSLFAGLGELPECSVVFRRGFFERRRCDLAAMQ